MNIRKIETGCGWVRVYGGVEFLSKTIVELPIACLNEVDGQGYPSLNDGGVNYDRDYKKIMKMLKDMISKGEAYLSLMDGGKDSKIIDAELLEIDGKRIVIGKIKILKSKDNDFNDPERLIRNLKNKDLNHHIFIAPKFKYNKENFSLLQFFYDV